MIQPEPGWVWTEVFFFLNLPEKNNRKNPTGAWKLPIYHSSPVPKFSCLNRVRSYFTPPVNTICIVMQLVCTWQPSWACTTLCTGTERGRWWASSKTSMSSSWASGFRNLLARQKDMRGLRMLAVCLAEEGAEKAEEVDVRTARDSDPGRNPDRQHCCSLPEGRGECGYQSRTMGICSLL